MKGLVHISFVMDDVPNPVPPGWMDKLGFVHWQEAAAIRLQRGENQGYCAACGRWLFPEECEHEKSATGPGGD